MMYVSNFGRNALHQLQRSADHWTRGSQRNTGLFKLGGLYAVVGIGCSGNIPFNLQM